MICKDCKQEVEIVEGNLTVRISPYNKDSVGVTMDLTCDECEKVVATADLGFADFEPSK